MGDVFTKPPVPATLNAHDGHGFEPTVPPVVARRFTVTRTVLTAALALFLLSSTGFAREYFVAADGHDANPGTRDRPFATLLRARDAIRALKRGAGLPPKGVTVRVAGGAYSLREPLALSARDSGTEDAPIVYRAHEGETVRLVGGHAVLGFKPVEDPAVLKRLDETVRGRVCEADLRSQGFTDFGEVATRGNRLELFFNDSPMRLARWPNEGFVQIKEVGGKTPFTIHGCEGTREGRFTYTGDRPSRWGDEQDVHLHGYWFWDWSDSFERVASVDTEKRTITLATPHHKYGYRAGQRYYALNVLAELDQPGEWYLDRKKGTVYFLPPAVEANEVVLSVLPHVLVLEDCSWVTIRGFTLEATRGTAVTVSGGRGNLVAGCVIRNTGGWAVSINGGERNAVRSCDISATGEGGITLRGGDRKTLRSAGHVAENNHIHDFGRIYRTYRPAVGLSGVGIRVAHNLIHNGPHNAIQLSGNDHVIEFNEIHTVCFETGDVGAFYMGRDWTARGTVIRHNYFHDIKGPGLHGAMSVYLDDAASGIRIVGNVFHRAGRAAFIGGGRDNLVENNVFVDCAASIHVDARGMGWMRNHVEGNGTLPQRLEAMPYRKPPWSTRYPKLVTILDDDPGHPKGNVVRRNISFGGRWLDVEKKAMEYLRFEHNLVDVDPHFVDLDKKDFRLRADSPAFALGFREIPVEKIGLYRDIYRRRLPE